MPVRRVALILLACIIAGPVIGSFSGSAAAIALEGGADEFSSSRAFEHAAKMVGFGPRPSGSDAIKKAQGYIISELKSSGLKVTEDDFVAKTPKGLLPMKNIIGQVQGAKPEVVIICGHYDTKQQAGFLGANDGGSSTAAVLELARVLGRSKPEYTLWFVFFDGEEAVVDWGAMNGMDNTYGSRHLASKMVSEGTIRQVKALILLDMIGDKELTIKREGQSTSWLVNLIWEAARAGGRDNVFVKDEHFISDDHLPFVEARVPSVDLIDFDYGPDHSYWHTNEDTLDKISGESMKIVGDVIIRALPALYKRLNQNTLLQKKSG